MTPAALAEVTASLAKYGARLTEDRRIAKGDNVLSVVAEVKRGRLRLTLNGALLASYPASSAGAGVADFVEKFWFWEVKS